MVKEIPLTQGKVALVDDEDYPLVSQYKWCIDKHKNNYYVQSRTMGKRVYLHRIILNPPKRYDCDHINGDGLDNRKCNLRIVTRTQNMMNCKKTSNASSKYKGVCWNKRVKKWITYIRVNGEETWLGYFNDEIDAAKIYDEAAKKYFGKYARLNFSEEENNLNE